MEMLEKIVRFSEELPGQIVTGAANAAATGIMLTYWATQALPARLSGTLTEYFASPDKPIIYAPRLGPDEFFDAIGAGIAGAAGLGGKHPVTRQAAGLAVSFVPNLLYWGTNMAKDKGYDAFPELTGDLAKDTALVLTVWGANYLLRYLSGRRTPTGGSP